jgi:di/tricarboxylate transporter
VTPVESTALVVVATVGLFIWNRLPVVIVAMGAALALWALGVITLNQAMAGFGDRAVMFVASLFIISAALEKTGVTAWAGQILVAKAGTSQSRLLAIVMTAAACLTALISGGGAVAALMPVVVMAAARLGHSPSQLLMPLAFASLAGSNLLLTGSPKNILISEMLEDAGHAGFGFAEFALAGVPLLAGTMAIILLAGKRLLPATSGARLPADFSRHAQVLVEHYGLADGLHHLRVRASSPLVGRRAAGLDLDAAQGIELLGLRAGGTPRPLGEAAMSAGDYLLVRGEAAAVARFCADQHLAPREAEEAGPAGAMMSRCTGLAEIVIPPRSAFIGRIVHPGMATEDGELVVLAVQRGGADLDTSHPELHPELQAGDTLLLQGSWKALDLKLADADVLVVDSPDLVRRQAVPMGAGAGLALGALGAFVVMLASGAVPPAVAGLVVAMALVACGVISVDESFRAIHWTTIILIGALMPLSTAMVQSGAADLAAGQLVAMTGGAGPHLFLAGLFVMTALLGQIMSNTATTLLMIPIALAAAASMGVSPKPVMMSLCVAGAAAFLTPIATSTNLMVMGPGGYRFGDYWKLGLPLLVWFFIVAVFYVPLVWRF